MELDRKLPRRAKRRLPPEMKTRGRSSSAQAIFTIPIERAPATNYRIRLVLPREICRLTKQLELFASPDQLEAAVTDLAVEHVNKNISSFHGNFQYGRVTVRPEDLRIVEKKEKKEEKEEKDRIEGMKRRRRKKKKKHTRVFYVTLEHSLMQLGSSLAYIEQFEAILISDIQKVNGVYEMRSMCVQLSFLKDEGLLGSLVLTEKTDSTTLAKPIFKHTVSLLEVTHLFSKTHLSKEMIPDQRTRDLSCSLMVKGQMPVVLQFAKANEKALFINFIRYVDTLRSRSQVGSSSEVGTILTRVGSELSGLSGLSQFSDVSSSHSWEGRSMAILRRDEPPRKILDALDTVRLAEPPSARVVRGGTTKSIKKKRSFMTKLTTFFSLK